MMPTTTSGAPARGGELAALRRFLARVRLRLWGARLGEGACRALAVAAVALGLDTLLGERIPVAPWAVFAVAASGSAAVLVALALLLRRGRPPAELDAALRVQAGLPGLRNDLETGLELAGGAGAAPGVSPALVAALVGRAGEDLARRRPADFVPVAGLRRAALLLAAAALPLAALALTGPGIGPDALRALVDPRVYWPLGRIALAVEPSSALVARGAPLVVTARVRGARPEAVLLRVEEGGAAGALLGMRREPDGSWAVRLGAVAADLRYRALADGAASPWGEVRVIDPPAAGNFEVAYTYPAYSGLEPRRVAGGGDLEALPGTTAEIGFATTRPVARGTLVAGDNRIAVAPAAGGRYAATLYLGGARSYRIELEDASGIGNGGGPEYAIRYLPDAPPEAEIVRPVGTVEGDPGGSVALAWRAADDFGLTRLELVSRLGAAERRRALGAASGARTAGGESEVDLAPLGARPGDVVTVVLEAVDNDAIGGPKTASSPPLAVTIADPRVRREEAREAMERLAEDLLEVLAEELELQGAYEELRERAERSWEDFPWEEAREAAARQGKAEEAARRAAERAEALSGALERDPAAGEETLLQAELIREGLERLRAGRLDPMREVAATLRPGETAREEAVEKSGYLGRTAEDAARAAEQLALMADDMRRGRRLAEAGRGAREMAEAEERLFEEIEKLAAGDEAAAREILEQLDALREALEELAEALARDGGELPEDFLNSEALRELDLGRILEALESVRERIRRGDLAGARQAARELAQRMGELRSSLQRAGDDYERAMSRALSRLRGETLPQIERLLAEERSLLARSEALAREAPPGREPGELPGLGEEQRRRSAALAAEQRAVRGRAERVGEELAALRAALPFIPGEAGQGLARAAGSMGEAADALAAPAPAAALDPERAAIAELARAAQAGREALEAMSRMQGARQGADMGSGPPMSMLPGGTKPGGGASSAPTRGRTPGGRRGLDVGDVPIPGRGDYRPPAVFREEIIRSLRDGYPAQYEQRIKDYYRRIAE